MPKTAWQERQDNINLGAGAGAGETNTASNQGSGTSIFYQKSGSDLQFNGIKSENAGISVALDSVTHDVELTLDVLGVHLGTSTPSDWSLTPIWIDTSNSVLKLSPDGGTTILQVLSW